VAGHAGPGALLVGIVLARVGVEYLHGIARHALVFIDYFDHHQSSAVDTEADQMSAEFHLPGEFNSFLTFE
jgi:hypothetical protein